MATVATTIGLHDVEYKFNKRSLIMKAPFLLWTGHIDGVGESYIEYRDVHITTNIDKVQAVFKEPTILESTPEYLDYYLATQPDYLGVLSHLYIRSLGRALKDKEIALDVVEWLEEKVWSICQSGEWMLSYYRFKYPHKELEALKASAACANTLRSLIKDKEVITYIDKILSGNYTKKQLTTIENEVIEKASYNDIIVEDGSYEACEAVFSHNTPYITNLAVLKNGLINDLTSSEVLEAMMANQALTADVCRTHLKL